MTIFFITSNYSFEPLYCDRQYLLYLLGQPTLPPQPIRPPIPTGVSAPPARAPQPPVSQVPANASPGLANAGASDQEKVIICKNLIRADFNNHF